MTTKTAENEKYKKDDTPAVLSVQSQMTFLSVGIQSNRISFTIGKHSKISATVSFDLCLFPKNLSPVGFPYRLHANG